MRPSQMDEGKRTMLMRQKIYRRRFHKSNEKKKRRKEEPDTSVARSEMRELHNVSCIFKDT